MLAPRAELPLAVSVPAFTIVPTALAGALQGMLAALLAALALYLGISMYGDDITRVEPGQSVGFLSYADLL